MYIYQRKAFGGLCSTKTEKKIVEAEYVYQIEKIKFIDHNDVPDVSIIEAKIVINAMKEKVKRKCGLTHSV